MGEQAISPTLDPDEMRAFERVLLADLVRLEEMLAADVFDAGPPRIGAEQEMFLVDARMDPAPVSDAVLERAHDPRLTAEIARFNLEANLPPLELGGRAFSAMREGLDEVLAVASRAAKAIGVDVVLVGGLPTLRTKHLSLDYMTPRPRFLALNKAMTEMRGAAFRIAIEGIDSLEVTHDNVMLEACNTSFQVHLQVRPEAYAHTYNVAQAVTAPLLAAAGNSPLLLGRRLWQETRVALFQQAVDTRSEAHQARGHLTRVGFGDRWLSRSVLELFREDVARFRVVATHDAARAAEAEPTGGPVHELRALRLHNSTIYRWNRPCFGLVDGVPHLRIENRVLPSGPTTADEVANAAFLVGLLVAGHDEWPDLTRELRFEDAKRNFISAARDGLDAHFVWRDGNTHTAAALIVDELLPLARRGLERAGVDEGDVSTYLGIVEERTRSRRTGSRWLLEALRELDPRGNSARASGGAADARHRELVASLIANQRDGAPVHTWKPCTPSRSEDTWRESYLTVGQFMTTSLFTLRPHDLVDLAAALMEWEHIRHVPVEDDHGKLVGLVTQRTLMKLIARGEQKPVSIDSIMHRDPITIGPNAPTLDAMRVMREHGVSSLLVVEAGKLVGIVTERDLIKVASSLLERALRDED